MIYLVAGNDPNQNIQQLRFLSTFNLTRSDFVIVLGNLGFQYKEAMGYYKTMPYTILFLEGLYDDTRLLYSYETTTWVGGKVHRLCDNVYHLIRCNLFTLNGKTLFVVGGDVTCTSKKLQINSDYYSKEAPSKQELEDAVKLLLDCNYTVDYILTTIPDSKTMLLFESNQQPSDLSNWLYDLSNKAVFDRWYFGQYPESIDKDFDKVTGVGDGVIPLGYSVHDIKEVHV